MLVNAGGRRALGVRALGGGKGRGREPVRRSDCMQQSLHAQRVYNAKREPGRAPAAHLGALELRVEFGLTDA